MSAIQGLLDLPKFVRPYMFHPWTALEVFLPHARFPSWIIQQNAFDPKSDIPSLEGKVIIVTGGNAGLGLETIYQLACHAPAKIYLAARSEQKAAEAIKQIEDRLQKESLEQPTILWLKLDLSDFGSVKSCASEFLSREKRLDVLVLNAGIMATPPSTSSTGHDLQLATNHLGHFLLTKLLMPLIEKTAGQGSKVCVIAVSSEAHHLAGADFLDLIESHDRLCSSTDYTRYGVSKAANILFASQLARIYGHKDITSVSLHPGLILTNLYSPARDSNILVRVGVESVASFVFDDIEHGTLNTLWCIAKAGSGDIKNGQYYTPVGKLRSSDLANNEASAERLWSWSEEQIKDFM